MDKDFQDRIDEYVLGRVSAEERLRFEKEICKNKEDKEQLQFTQDVKSAISSRQEKLERLEEMKNYHSASSTITPVSFNNCRPPESRKQKFSSTRPKKVLDKRYWLWASSIAAALIMGYFIFSPSKYQSDLWEHPSDYDFPLYEGAPFGVTYGNEGEIIDNDLPMYGTTEENDTISNDSLNL